MPVRLFHAVIGRILPAMLLLAGATPRVVAAEPREYLVDTWRFDDELPRDGINSIAQGKDGFLWVSSRYGLARFDGVRFADWSARTSAQFLGYHFANLTVDRLGAVWIATPGTGLLEWREGKLASHLAAGNPVFGPVFAGLTNAQGRPLVMTPDARLLGFTNGAAQAIAQVDRWGEPVPPSICQDREASIWFVTYQHKLVRVRGTNAQEMTFGEGEKRRNWIALQADEAGQIWAGTQLEIGFWRGDEFVPIPSPTDSLPVEDIIGVAKSSSANAPTAAAGKRFWVIALGRAWLLESERWVTNVLFEPAAGLYETSPRIVDREGNLWFATTKASIVRADTGGGLLVFTGEQGLPSGRVRSLYEDQEGSIWVGIEHAGLARLRERFFAPVATREGLKAPLVWAVLEDSAGAIWLGTENNGLQRWQAGKLTQFDLANNNLASSVYSLCLDHEGRVWAGTADSRVFRFENGKFVLVWENVTPGWNKNVYAIYEDRAGQMWFATGLGLFRWKEGTAQRLSGRGFASGVLRVVCEDKAGRVWVGRSGGDQPRLAYVEGDELVERGVAEGLSGYDIFGLRAGADGSLWIGTVGNGLWRHRDGVFTHYTATNGLPDDRIYSIQPDAAGNLWLGSPIGIIHVTSESLVRRDTDAEAQLDCLVFNRTDGLPTRECSGGTQPVIFRARDGRLLFALTQGAAALSATGIQRNTRPPPVLIEEIRADGKVVGGEERGVNVERGAWSVERGGEDGRTLAPGRHVVEFRYTATSLAAPAKVRFRHRLEGVDQSWREADASRSAVYALTAPGDYQFHVIACNNDGVWNETGATARLIVQPFFWETWTFRIATALGLAAAIGGTIRLLERRKIRRHLEQLESERRIGQERARIARDIHDELGANLTEIALLSEFAQRDSSSPEQVKADVSQIAAKAAGSTRALDEIVWAVNPRNDTLESFVSYACAYAEEHLRLANIRCRLDVASPLPQRALRADSRHHLFLAFKETLTNVVKHAGAGEVAIGVRLHDDRLQISIADNGCGFDPATPTARNGLRNMKERLENAGGGFACASAPGRGTKIRLAMKLE